LDQVEVFVRTLHPQVMGRRFVWRAGAGVAVLEAPHELFESAEFRRGAIARVCAFGEVLRRRLAAADCPMDCPELPGLREQGASDYLVAPRVFPDGAVHAAAWPTRRPGGFAATDLAAIDAVIRPLARVAEVRALARTAGNLLDSYVGHRTG